jgi:hypothetical protein
LAADLSQHASIRGAGAEASAIEGSIIGLRDAAFLEDLTVTRGLRGGITMTPTESARIERVWVAGNRGPGVTLANHGTLHAANCLIVGNSGGGVSIDPNAYGALQLFHSTVADNDGSWSYYTPRVVFTLDGNLIVGHGAAASFEPFISQSLFFDPASLDPGNLANAPLFLAPAHYDFSRFELTSLGPVPDFVVEPGNYRLFPGSTARDAVAEPIAAAGELDLARAPRVACGQADMGAYEMQDCVALPGPLASVSPRLGTVPFVVAFDGAAAAAVPGGPWSLEWDFGDGVRAEGPLAKHLYELPGLYYPHLEVANAAGARVSIPAGEIVARGDVWPWSATDIGEPETPGISYFEDGCLSIASEGGGHVVYQEIEGDVVLEARLTATDFFPRTGLFLANDPKLSDGFVSLHVPGRPPYPLSLEARSCATCMINWRGVGMSFDGGGGVWLRIVRQQAKVSAFASVDGVSWTLLASPYFNWPSTLYAGVLVRDRTWPLATAPFCNLRLSPLGPEFRRGEASGDGAVNITDALFTLNHLFLGGAAPACLAAADANGDLLLNITDPLALLGHLFLGGPAPPAPFPECGPDPGAGALPCERAAGCGADG